MLCVILARPLDPLYAERWQTTAVGARGGLEVRPPFRPHVAVCPQRYFDDFNAWFALYGDSATTEHLKPAASHAKKADILRQVPAWPRLGAALYVLITGPAACNADAACCHAR